MPAAGASVTAQQVEDVYSKALGKGPESVVDRRQRRFGHRADPLGDA